jgi:lipopolysaccharide transport system ATP-binding protein
MRTVHAVRDISFDVELGEVVGLIGPNGAGKSTLLKLLSRVTRPTGGYAEIRGRVGSLLEVGTGFHPELTGRENVFLSGAILGMSRAETAARYEAIVEFAEVAPFMNTPVKHFSSGMYARLGFAVAAHLRPAVLIVDEVLAVGDVAFQAKCLTFMKRLAETGTTVLFVSHNLVAVGDFCTRALVMEKGRLAFDGSVAGAISEYRRSLTRLRGPDGGGVPHEISFNGAVVRKSLIVAPNQPAQIDLSVDHPSGRAAVAVVINVHIESGDGRMAIHLKSSTSASRLALRPGRNVWRVSIDDLPLAPGAYWLWLRVVGQDVSAPYMWDTDRVLLEVTGAHLLESIAVPRHRFEQIV